MQSQQSAPKNVIVQSVAEIGWLSAHGVEPIAVTYVRSTSTTSNDVIRLVYIYDGDVKSKVWRLRRLWRDPKSAATRKFLDRFAAAVRERIVRSSEDLHAKRRAADGAPA